MELITELEHLQSDRKHKERPPRSIRHRPRI